MEEEVREQYLTILELIKNFTGIIFYHIVSMVENMIY